MKDLVSEIELLTETSWEVCNKIGGINTVIRTKTAELKKVFGDRLVYLGPLTGEPSAEVFTEKKTILKKFSSRKLPSGIKVRVGRWNIPGEPIAILVDFKSIFPRLNEFYGRMWEMFRVDSLHAYGDYDESCAFSIACAIVIDELTKHLGVNPGRCIAHFDEWTTGMGLLYLKDINPNIATVFTTHATTVGRSICGNGKPLYQYFANYNGDQMASELNVESKHSLEKRAAENADCFTTVSEVTARECEQLLGIKPDVVTPNGFEPSFVPDRRIARRLRQAGRNKILKIASILAGREMGEDALIVATSGRNEYRNKGIDLFLDSMVRAAENNPDPAKEILALVMVPAWVKQPSGDLVVDLDFGGWIKPDPDYLTHRLFNEDQDMIASNIRRLEGYIKERGLAGRIKLVYLPSYLDGSDGILDIEYYDFLPALDLTVFASYYEPWGYTPLESIAFGVPTITTDKAGFGQWAIDAGKDSLPKAGVKVIERNDDTYGKSVEEISDAVIDYMKMDGVQVKRARAGALTTSKQAEWRLFISKYMEAFDIALERAEKNKIENN